ncbi:MFS transporter [Nocardia sp. 348MFTsu5.1]|uniref:MFS transporter n=1 Tax=Nocardia sp. 348MFTsu5.1 TaxID=1172185 RepID=UPI0003724308|nr:MFS transporter [Nocardia sp. 348MFTsu5.1]
MKTLEAKPVKPRVLIAVLCFGGLLASFMQTLVIPIVGRLPAYLDTTSDNASWVITATLLTAAVAMPIAGRLADMFGKRRIILACIGAMIIGSIICAMTSMVVPMIIGRGTQGLAMGVIPCGISLLRDKLDPARIPGAIATMSATLGVGGAIGLPVAAWITQTFDWHVIFWVAAGLAVFTFALVFTLVSESDARSPGTFDFVGATGLTAALVSLLLALSKGSTWGWASALTVGLATFGLVTLTAWGWFELRIKTPLVDLRTSRQPVIVLTNAASVLFGFSLMAIGLAAPQLLQIPNIPGVVDYGMGQTILATGLILAPGGLMMMFFSPVSARMNIKIGPKITLLIGGVVITLGYVMSVFMMTEPWQIFVCNIVVSIGVGIGYSAMPALIMSAAPLHQMAAANSLNSLMRSIGTAIASALLATILASSVIDLGGGHHVPTESAFQLVFIIGSGAALLAALIALSIPYKFVRQSAGSGVIESNTIAAKV